MCMDIKRIFLCMQISHVHEQKFSKAILRSLCESVDFKVNNLMYTCVDAHELDKSSTMCVRVCT